MKQTLSSLLLGLGLCNTLNAQTPQTTLADFENLSLPADTFYENHNANASWQTSNATFRYKWDPAFGGYWGYGFSYSNKNNTVTPTYHNQYAAITGKGYANSNNYVIAWEGYNPNMSVVLKSPSQYVNGFYVTNTTYGYKVMKNGGAPARAFGDTAHAHTTTITPGNYPDWFKLTVYGYKTGVKKTDTVEFYLADYRFSDNSKDYIVDSWKWVDCSGLGAVDSITFKLFSSDIGPAGINNPTYFAIDNFTTSDFILYTDLSPLGSASIVQAGPNPFQSQLKIHNPATKSLLVTVRDALGKIIFKNEVRDAEYLLDLSAAPEGTYFMQVETDGNSTIQQLIKNR